MTAQQHLSPAADPTPSFERYAGTAPDNYERYFVPVIAGPLAETLVGRAGLEPDARVVDLACGTGIVARLAAARPGASGSVIGIDINPGMLAVARASRPGGAPVAWREANAAALPLDNESQDAVLCQMGLQFFPDKPAALREVRRVLVRHGQVILNVPGPIPQIFQVIEQALARHVSRDVAAFMKAVFSLHEPAEIVGLLQSAGFETVDAVAETRALRLPPPDAFLWEYVHSTPLAAAVAALDHTTRTAFEREVVEGTRQFVENGRLILELGVTTASGRK